LGLGLLLLLVVSLHGFQKISNFLDGLDLVVGIGLQRGQLGHTEGLADAVQHLDGILIGGIVAHIDDLQVLGPVGVELLLQDHLGTLTCNGKNVIRMGLFTISPI